MVIRVLDHVLHCYDWNDGQKLASVLFDAMSRSGEVVVSFDGVRDVPSSFVNGAFVPLLGRWSLDDIKSRMRVVDSTRQINTMIKKRLEFEGAQQRVRGLDTGTLQLRAGGTDLAAGC